MPEQTGPYTQVQMKQMSENTADVVAYRLGMVEQSLRELGHKFDLIGSSYLTHQTLDLILTPMKTDIIELTGKDREREKERNAFSSQLKLAIMVCIASPVASLFVSLIVVNKGG